MASTHEEISRTEDDCVCTFIGTIDSIDRNANTATVTGNGETYNNIDIFYHCNGETDTAKGHKAFYPGDSVVCVKVGDLDPKIVAYQGGRRPCVGPYYVVFTVHNNITGGENCIVWNVTENIPAQIDGVSFPCLPSEIAEWRATKYVAQHYTQCHDYPTDWDRDAVHSMTDSNFPDDFSYSCDPGDESPWRTAELSGVDYIEASTYSNEWGEWTRGVTDIVMPNFFGESTSYKKVFPGIKYQEKSGGPVYYSKGYAEFYLRDRMCGLNGYVEEWDGGWAEDDDELNLAFFGSILSNITFSDKIYGSTGQIRWTLDDTSGRRWKYVVFRCITEDYTYEDGVLTKVCRNKPFCAHRTGHPDSHPAQLIVPVFNNELDDMEFYRLTSSNFPRYESWYSNYNFEYAEYTTVAESFIDWIVLADFTNIDGTLMDSRFIVSEYTPCRVNADNVADTSQPITQRKHQEVPLPRSMEEEWGEFDFPSYNANSSEDYWPEVSNKNGYAPGLVTIIGDDTPGIVLSNHKDTIADAADGEKALRKSAGYSWTNSVDEVAVLIHLFWFIGAQNNNGTVTGFCDVLGVAGAMQGEVWEGRPDTAAILSNDILSNLIKQAVKANVEDSGILNSNPTIHVYDGKYLEVNSIDRLPSSEEKYEFQDEFANYYAYMGNLKIVSSDFYEAREIIYDFSTQKLRMLVDVLDFKTEILSDTPFEQTSSEKDEYRPLTYIV